MQRVGLFARAALARAYPRVALIKRQPMWILQETVLPLLSVSAFVLVYRWMEAPEEYIGFVILGGAMAAFWLNVLWSVGAQLYWERSSGNLELYIMSPAPLAAVLGGVALGGLGTTFVRATAILSAGAFAFGVPFDFSNWVPLVVVFGGTMLALYGLGMMFASLFLLWGREAWHLVNMLQEPVYVLSGMNYPLRILPTLVASVAAAIPLATGMDAMRQLLFDYKGIMPVPAAATLVFSQAGVFLYLAYRLLRYLERRAAEEGRLTVKWQ